MLAPLALKSQWREALDQVRAHGSGRIDLTGVKADGSRLLAEIVELAATMEVTTTPRPTTLRLDLENTERELWPFVQTEGFVTAGTETAVYEGSAWNGMFSIRMPIALSPSVSREQLTFNFDTGGWAGRVLAELPYAAKINEFAEKLRSDWRPRLTMEVEGVEAFTHLGSADEATISSLDFYRYIHACAKIDRWARSGARFQPDVLVTRQEFDAAIEACNQHDPVWC